MFEGMERAGYGVGAGVVLSRDPKPRLRWTPDLHERFVEAVTKLGGPDSKGDAQVGAETDGHERAHLVPPKEPSSEIQDGKAEQERYRLRNQQRSLLCTGHQFLLCGASKRSVRWEQQYGRNAARRRPKISNRSPKEAARAARGSEEAANAHRGARQVPANNPREGPEKPLLRSRRRRKPRDNQVAAHRLQPSSFGVHGRRDAGLPAERRRAGQGLVRGQPQSRQPGLPALPRSPGRRRREMRHGRGPAPAGSEHQRRRVRPSPVLPRHAARRGGPDGRPAQKVNVFQ